MDKVKVKVIKGENTPTGDYYQGEYHADLSNAYVETFPVFAAHLVNAGYAEYLKKDEPKPAEPAMPDTVFVERDAPEPNSAIYQPQPDAPAIPTEEITLGEKSEPKNKKSTKGDKS